MAGPLLTNTAWSLAAATLAAQLLLSAAQQQGTVAEAGCRAAAERRIAGWGAGAERYRDPDGPFGEAQWRLPTHEIGTWVLVQETAGGAPSLARVDARSTTRVSFDAQCREQSTTSAAQPGATRDSAAFSDDDVRALLGAAPQGVIYLWSPHMPLSVDGYRTVSDLARRLRMSFTAVRDPMSDAGYAAAVAREAGLPASALRTFTSIELSFRQLNLHAPAVLVFSAGRFDGLAVPGYREAAGFEAAIAGRISNR
jgi:hypothetical protein